MVENGVPSAPTEGMPEGFLAPGQVLGDRYQIKSQLGRGGMGEVWRAFDLKLRVEVALKAMLPDLFKDEKRRDMLRREVRAAREVVSPNVCRIFDLIEADGSELVSMEYVDGGTLLEVLQGRGPLDLKEAQDIASQFLAGLEAIHQAGLVHRDVKPENIMITRAGRVVLMDFGLARQEDSGAGTVSGTPAYMAPEQAAGLHVDARADVYSAGVVLAEMVSPDGIKDLQSRQSVWEGIRHEPARVPDSPWAPVLKKAVAKEPDQRYNSAHTLTRALEDVTLRVEGAEDLTPYPGLASFTEDDAEYFFGREAEVEQMWRKLEGPARLLAIAGPSGAGKTSFLRAGLVPNSPPGWTIIRCTPGNAPMNALAGALASETAGDPEAVKMLLRFHEPEVAVDIVSRWRRRHEHALLIVDQFEELFTLNPPEVQRQVASLLGQLVLEADIVVLLSLRDDYLFRCHQSESLRPSLADLTMLGPPEGAALRRALVQPATKCGYRFEDDELVEEMHAEVESERGALPMLAFAAARLWEERDRENGLLTRQAHMDIGGVGGALARHAEATIDRIGVERLPVVREIFRNLVTAEGTRAVREWDEILSVFSDSQSESPAAVLRALIDARLLTSYEVKEEDREPTRRVEIIHESLLANWPRLVRWQTQDADAAQLRDQLRQAAKTWDERGRTDDTLWIGSAYREFASWRERYPGGLSELEESFAAAMTSFANRRRRRRRMAAAAVLVIAVIVATVFGALWRRSVLETRRAEAQKLLALGQLEIEENTSAAVAYAVTSLEYADSPEARLLALEALWRGPTALVVNEEDTVWRPRFSENGRFIVQSVGGPVGEVRILRNDGSAIILDRVHAANQVLYAVSPQSDIIVTWDRHDNPSPQHIVFWSASDGQRLAEVRYHQDVTFNHWDLGWRGSTLLLPIIENGRGYLDAADFRGNRRRLGEIAPGFVGDHRPRIDLAIDRLTGRWLGRAVGNDVVVHQISDDHLGPPRHLGRHEGNLTLTKLDPLGRYLATADEDGEIRLWDPFGVSAPIILQGPRGTRYVAFSEDGSLLYATAVEDDYERVWMWSVGESKPRLLRRFNIGEHRPASFKNIDPAGGHLARAGQDRKIRIWRFRAPAEAEPLFLGREETAQLWTPEFDHRGLWLASGSGSGLALYPLGQPYPSVMDHDSEWVTTVEFEPDGKWLASCGSFEAVRIWPLDGDVPAPGHAPYTDRPLNLAVSPSGQQLLVGTIKDTEQGDLLISVDGSTRKLLTGFLHYTSGVAFSPDGRLAAAAGGSWEERENVIRVWDVSSGAELEVLIPSGDLESTKIQFSDESHLLAIDEVGLWQWDLKTGNGTLLYEGKFGDFSAAENGRRVALVTVEDQPHTGHAMVLDVESGIATMLEAHGSRLSSIELENSGAIVATGAVDGIVRVGSVNGSLPHLLLGHTGVVRDLSFDPLGRYVASGAHDGTVRLWPMPDLTKPPLHTLPREELITKLKSLTNLRAVRDEESSTGWTLTHDPFPGWETVPTWQ